MKEYRYPVTITYNSEVGYEVRCPLLPEVLTFGKTEAQAKELAADAVLTVVQDYLASGKELPVLNTPSSLMVCVKVATVADKYTLTSAYLEQ